MSLDKAENSIKLDAHQGVCSVWVTKVAFKEEEPNTVSKKERQCFPLVLNICHTKAPLKFFSIIISFSFFLFFLFTYISPLSLSFLLDHSFFFNEPPSLKTNFHFLPQKLQRSNELGFQICQPLGRSPIFTSQNSEDMDLLLFSLVTPSSCSSLSNLVSELGFVAGFQNKWWTGKVSTVRLEQWQIQVQFHNGIYTQGKNPSSENA